MFLEYDKWVNNFKPIVVDENLPWGGCYIDGGNFATNQMLDVLANHFGKKDDLARARAQYPFRDGADQDAFFVMAFGDCNFLRDHAWTVTESDGIYNITPGFAFVNRQGFLLTEVPHPENADIIVFDPSDFPDHKFSDWRAALVEVDDDEVEDDELPNAENVGQAQSSIHDLLMSTGLYDSVWIDAGKLSTKLKPEFAELSPNEDMAERILDSRFGAESAQRFKPFDESAVSTRQIDVLRVQIEYQGELIGTFAQNLGRRVGELPDDHIATALMLYYGGMRGVPAIGEQYVICPQPASPAPAH